MTKEATFIYDEMYSDEYDEIDIMTEMFETIKNMSYGQFCDCISIMKEDKNNE